MDEIKTRALKAKWDRRLWIALNQVVGTSTYFRHVTESVKEEMREAGVEEPECFVSAECGPAESVAKPEVFGTRVEDLRLLDEPWTSSIQ